MTQKTQTAYNQWFNEQIHLLSDLTDSLHETEDPHKKLVIYDDVIERAKKFVRKCKKHEKAKNLSLSRLQEAEKELYFYEGIKQRYLDDYFEKELETVVDEKSLAKEIADERREVEEIKLHIYYAVRGGGVVFFDEIVHSFGEIAKKAVNEMIEGEQVAQCYLQERMALQLPEEKSTTSEFETLQGAPLSYKGLMTTLLGLFVGWYGIYQYVLLTLD